MNNLYMVIWSDLALAQNTTLDASLVRCGQGSVAPLWTPPNAQAEVAKCKRYYNTSYNTQPAGSVSAVNGRIVGVSVTTGAGELSLPVFLGTEMRTQPTVALYNPTTGGAGTMRDESGGLDVAASTPAGIGTQSFRIINTGSIGAPPRVMSVHYTASAEL
jgi:hypothetical protein